MGTSVGCRNNLISLWSLETSVMSAKVHDKLVTRLTRIQKKWKATLFTSSAWMKAKRSCDVITLGFFVIWYSTVDQMPRSRQRAHCFFSLFISFTWKLVVCWSIVKENRPFRHCIQTYCSTVALCSLNNKFQKQDVNL